MMHKNGVQKGNLNLRGSFAKNKTVVNGIQ